jgi:uncharacterized membrane protein
MGKFRGARYLLCLALFFGVLGSLFGSQLALAAQESRQVDALLPPGQEEPPPEESINVFARYPIQQSVVGNAFEFEITLYYEGPEARTFDLDAVLPEGWTGTFIGGYPETEISAFTVEPMKERETITFIVAPSEENMPAPGEYLFTVSAFSGDLSDSVDLKVIVVTAAPQYLLYMSTATLQSEFSIRPDQPNHISVQLLNAQTGTVNDIVFSAEKPEGWDVIFTPSTIASLEYGVTQEIDVVVTPPAGTEAGDYPLVLEARGDQTDAEREYRMTVITSTAWGVAGIIIAIAIIVGLAIWFRQSGTRGEAETASPASWFKRTAARFKRSPKK